MRLCRCLHQGSTQVAFFHDGTRDSAWPSGCRVWRISANHGQLARLLTARGRCCFGGLELAPTLSSGRTRTRNACRSRCKLSVRAHRNTFKIILLAGNYAEHIKEGGGQAAERRDTFRTSSASRRVPRLPIPAMPVRIPAVSPHSIDWEIELGVIIGRRCHGVQEERREPCRRLYDLQ